MKKGSAIFLQVVIVLFGMGVMTFMIWEPTVEGVNAHATLFQIYVNFFVAYVYLASIPFFTGLHQAIKVLGYAGQNKVFSPEAVKALRTIKLCAITIIGFVVVSVVFMINGGPEDQPPGVTMRLAVIFGSIVVATAAAVFERILQNAVDLKSENDLTV